jgi:hypothetical protein
MFQTTQQIIPTENLPVYLKEYERFSHSACLSKLKTQPENLI